jgi:hypothetical protein
MVVAGCLAETRLFSRNQRDLGTRVP